MHNLIEVFFIIITAYIIGSIPTGYILVKALKGEDIRNIGSGSIGATNVKRMLGTWAFITVMIIDTLKGCVPVLASEYLALKLNIPHMASIIPVLASIAVIIGHSKSIFLNFSGGKSVASGVGTIFGLCWPVGLITVFIWIILTYTTRYVSVGSIIAVLLAPVWMLVFNQPASYVLFCLIGGLYIVYLHRSNIKRLIAGKENKIT